MAPETSTRPSAAAALRAAPRLEALLFDVDGTIADTEEVHRRAFNQAFAAAGLDWHWDAPLYRRLLEITGGKERIAGYIAQLEMTEEARVRLRERIASLHRAKNAHYKELVGAGIRPLAGIRRLLLAAREAGLRLAIASTTSAENVEPMLRAALGDDSPRWFHVIATGDVVQNKKPAPDIYRLALQRLGVAPVAAVAFEDSALGVRAAKDAGLFTVAVPNVWTHGQDFSPADLVLGTLGDPDQPLSDAEARRIGAPQLSLERLVALHAGSSRGAMPS